MTLGPLPLEPIHVPKPWGGSAFRRLFGRPVPVEARLGESWEVADRPDAQSRVSAGPHRGKTLGELRRDFGEDLIGSVPAGRTPGRFPLLIKWIDALELLSVQVHPDDAGARALGEADPGKSEAWVVADATSGARLIYGLAGDVTPATLIRAAEGGDIDRHLGWTPARPGDGFLVPPGLVHALGAGIVVYEVQQNSDLTYRIWDWGRTDSEGRARPLHLDRARAVLKGDLRPTAPLPVLKYPAEGGSRRHVAASPHFALEILEVAQGGAFPERCDGRSFHALTALSGKGELRWENPGSAPEDPDRFPVSAGCTVLVPAGAGAYRLTSTAGLAICKSFVPDLETDAFAPLRRAGYRDKEIRKILSPG